MKVINFEQFKVYQDIAKKYPKIINAKEEFANLIYNKAAGLAYHALALKIYNSKGDEEYDENECKLIKEFANQCIPAFIDAIDELLKD